MNDWTTEKVMEIQDPFEIGCGNGEKAELTKLFNNAVRLAKSDVEDQKLFINSEGWVAEESVAIAASLLDQVPR